MNEDETVDETVIADLDVENTNPDGNEGEQVPPTPTDEDLPEDDTRVLTA